MNNKYNTKPEYWEKAKKYLIKHDYILRKVIQSVDNKHYLTRNSTPFQTLANAIIGQQISVAAASSVLKKLKLNINGFTPKKVHLAGDTTLKNSGLSRQKVGYLKNLANAFIEKKIKIKTWEKMTDEEIIQDLIQIKGIGRWTAEMFLIFNLCRADIFPLDDIGMIKGLCKLYDIPYPTERETIINIGKKWKPYRSVATWYLWRSLDPIPVEY